MFLITKFVYVFRSLTTTHQHDDPNSYTWCLVRYAAVHLVLHNLTLFLPQIGIELAGEVEIRFGLKPLK